MRELLFGAKVLGYSIAVSQIVIEELKTKYEEKSAESFGRIKKELDELRRFGLELTDPEWGTTSFSHVWQYRAFVERFFCQPPFCLLPYPSVSHEVLVKRALHRKRPFPEAGKDKEAYRDALIWETVLEGLTRENTECVFISKNTKEFAQSPGSDELHEHLSRDVARVAADSSAFSFFTSVSKFNQIRVAPNLRQTEAELDLQRALETSGRVHGLELQSVADVYLADALPEWASRIARGRFGREILGAEYLELVEVHALTSIEVHLLKPENGVAGSPWLVRAEFRVLSDIEFYFDKGSSLAIDLFHGREDWEGEATEQIEHFVTVLFVFNPLTKGIDSFEITSVSPPFNWRASLFTIKAQSGGSPFQLKKWHGHARLNTTSSFVHMARQNAKKTMEVTGLRAPSRLLTTLHCCQQASYRI